MAFSQLGMNKAQVVDKAKLMMFAKATGIPFKGSEEGSDEMQDGDHYLQMHGYAAQHMAPASSVYDHFGRPGTMIAYENFVKSYRSWKKEYGYLDFDDMLRAYVKYGSPLEEFQYIHLDEAQDCSPLQWRVFEKMCPANAAVMIAGDDDQAIFQWSGADPHGMAAFMERHGGIMNVLDRSHRIPKLHHDLVHNKILAGIGRRVDKTFNYRNATGTIERYGDIININLRKFYNNGGGMILARDRWRVNEIKRILNREMIPYDMMGGHSPWTNYTAKQIREGTFDGWTAKNIQWRDFYTQADLSLPVNITLSTIHQAKGREAKSVIVDLSMPGRVQESMYLDRDAELRVWYVALTRSSDELILCGNNSIL
jgi:superfamily I DNA/RNA helicase